MLGLLRQATSDAHAAIEGVVPLLDPRLDRGGYVRYLAHLVRFFGPLERALERHDARLEAEGFSPELGTRTRALRADLRALGAEEPCDDAPSHALPELPSAAHAVGCLYVLEGSRLGGRVLAAHLEGRLGVVPDREATFLAPDPEGTGVRWARFRATLATYGETHAAHADDVVAGALRTFSTLHAWLVGGAPYLA